MVTVVTRADNGIPLTHQQVDNNFIDLADAVNNVGSEILAEATAAKNDAQAAAGSAQGSALSAGNAANAASISRGNAATSAEQAANSATSANSSAIAAAASAAESGEQVTALRADLIASDGTDLVSYGSRTVTERLDDSISILKFGAVGNGSTDCLAALLSAKAANNRAHFPRVNDSPTTYFFSFFSAGLIDGMTLSADQGVTLSFSHDAPYSLYNKVNFYSNISVFFRNIGISYIFLATPVVFAKPALSLAPAMKKRKNTALDCANPLIVTPRTNDWNTSDSFNITPATTASNSLSFPDAGVVNSFRGGFATLGVWETISAYFDNGLSAGPIGVIIRGSLGFTLIYSAASTQNYFTASKLTGQPATTAVANLPWTTLGQGVYTSFAPDASVWGITRVDEISCIVRVNGKAITQPFAQDIGVIQEVGFVSYGSSPFSVSGFTVERRIDAITSMPSLSAVIFGDSTAQQFPTSWSEFLPPLLNDLYGVALTSLVNRAVAGETLDQQYALMQTVGFGDAYYVIVCAGTNNIQGLQSLSAWANVVANTIDYIKANGRKPLFIIPWMWYTQAQSGGVGQPSANYDKGAPYRMIMERICDEKNVLVVKPNDDLPNPSPALLTTAPLARLLRDNIHQDQLGYQLYAQMVAKALAEDYMGTPDCVEEFLSGDVMMNGATASTDLRFMYDKAGECSITGTIVVTTITTGTALFKVGRHIAPRVQCNVAVIALNSSQIPIGTCWLSIDPATMAATLSGAPVGTTILISTGSRWKIGAA